MSSMHQMKRFFRTCTRVASQDKPQINYFELLLRTMIPLHAMPYQEQLEKKNLFTAKALQKVANILTNNIRNKTKNIQMQIERNDGMICKPEPIRLSPVTEEYRNKDALSVGVGVDGNPKSVGFYVMVKKDLLVAHAHLKIHRRQHYEIGRAYEEFLQQSPLGVVAPGIYNEGHWRHLVVKSNLQGQTMANVSFHPRDLHREAVMEAKVCLQEYFQHGPGKNTGLTSLTFQESEKVRSSEEESPHQPLFGPPHILQPLMDMTFRISPDAFFQVNSAAAEVLYKTVIELLGDQKDSILLDVCCGTGTIALILAKHVQRVVGIERGLMAVEDARYNAQLNGIDNAEFYCGQAERLVKAFGYKFESSGKTHQVVAVVNPSRVGLGDKVIKALRKCDPVRKVVYVSCDPLGWASLNFVGLSKPETEDWPGQPFIITHAVPVDMFPHTRHFELALLFER